MYVAYLNNVFETYVQNYQEISQDFSFDSFSQNANFLETFFPEFVKTNDTFDGVTFLQNWPTHIPVPFRVFDHFSNTNIFNGYINLLSPENQYDDEKGIYKVKAEQIAANIIDKIKGLNIRELYKNPAVSPMYSLSPPQFGKTRYILAGVPDYLTSIVVGISAYIMIKEAAECIMNIVNLIAHVAGGATGVVAAIAYGAGYVIYLITIIAGIIALIKQLSDVLFQKPKAYYHIDVETILIRAFGYIGLQFQSGLFSGVFKDTKIIWSTVEKGRLNGNPTNNPLPDTNLLDFVESISKIFNAKLRILNGVATLESKPFYQQNQQAFVIPQLKDSGTYAFNGDELYGTIKINFTEDFSDLNVQINRATITYSTPRVIGIPQIDLLTKELEVNIRYAVMQRKLSVTKTEKILNGIFDFFNKIIQTIGAVFGNPMSKTNFGTRVGYALLGNDGINVPRIFRSDGERIHKDTFLYFEAGYIYNQYYRIESPKQNQWKKWKGRSETPFVNPTLVLQLAANNVVTDFEGRLALIETNIRDAQTGLHELSYRSRFQYIPQNIITEKIEIG